MSSVVIAGNTSGTITLDAPDVAGSTTLNLPATSGSLMVNGPAFSAYQSTDQTGLSSAVYTKCNFQAEEFDTNNNFVSSRFTPTVEGYYQINWGADIYIVGGGTGFVAMLYKNGNIQVRESSGLFAGSATEVQCTGSTIVYMNGSTDYLEVFVRATGGSARQTYAGAPYTYFNGYLARSA